MIVHFEQRANVLAISPCVPHFTLCSICLTLFCVFQTGCVEGTAPLVALGLLARCVARIPFHLSPHMQTVIDPLNADHQVGRNCPTVDSKDILSNRAEHEGVATAKLQKITW